VYHNSVRDADFFNGLLAQGWAVEKACRLATATAALVATGLGTDAGVVNLERTIRAMETLAVLD
jgi:sugar/nucleoside kinase (ribokinase family)